MILSTLENLLNLIENEPILNINKTVNNRCVFIQANMKHGDVGTNYIRKIRQWIDHGEYPTLEYITVFNHYDCDNTIKVCKKDDDKYYDCLIDCIEDHHHQCKPYED